MKKLRFHYEMELTFDSPVVEHHYVFRCLPMEDEGQKCYGLKYDIEPSGRICEIRDGFGNRTCVGEAMKPHSRLKVWVEGTVFANRQKETLKEAHPMYRFQSSFTEPDEGLYRYMKEKRRQWEDACEKVPPPQDHRFPLYLMDGLYGDFVYMPGSTDVTTTAAEAFAKGEGVCQDYAHIFLALCRMSGYPARYVAGMMVGEGATHAWTEIYVDGAWVGFDPTHNRLVNDDYIKLSHGRDFGDCTVDKGCFKGFAAQKQNIYVKVEE